MPKPTQGKPYTIVYGDTLSAIALAAYGDPAKWRKIWSANQTVLESGDPNMIYPGEVIMIPVDEVVRSVVVASRDAARRAAKQDKPDQRLELEIDGQVISYQSMRVIRTIDTAADSWTAVLPSDRSDPDLFALLKPYKYQNAKVSIDGVRLITGYLYGLKCEVKSDGITKELEGFSHTADIIDSTMKPPYQADNVTLYRYAKDIASRYGINVVYEAEEGQPFKRVRAKKDETVFEHLSNLAAQRSVLVSSTPNGELLFQKATKSKSVGTLDEAQSNVLSMSIHFDGRQRFNTYKLLGQTPKSLKNKAIAKDEAVPLSRFLTVKRDNHDKSTIKNNANWHRSKAIADALTIQLQVAEWYAPNGRLWAENTMVTLVAPSLYIKDGFTFLIKQVEYSQGSDGMTTKLDLVPLETYTGEEIKEPWV
jgi:prophage tail gpP-like protein